MDNSGDRPRTVLPTHTSRATSALLAPPVRTLLLTVGRDEWFFHISTALPVAQLIEHKLHITVLVEDLCELTHLPSNIPWQDQHSTLSLSFSGPITCSSDAIIFLRRLARKAWESSTKQKIASLRIGLLRSKR